MENSILNKSVWWFSTSPKFDFTRLKPQKSLILRRFFHPKPQDVHRLSHRLWRTFPVSCGKVFRNIRYPQRPPYDKSEPAQGSLSRYFQTYRFNQLSNLGLTESGRALHAEQARRHPPRTFCKRFLDLQKLLKRII